MLIPPNPQLIGNLGLAWLRVLKVAARSKGKAKVRETLAEKIGINATTAAR